MKVIGLLFGMEQTFPPALVERINSTAPDGIRAEFVKIGGVRMDDILKYDVILDRISQDIPFYRAMLKLAALGGTRIVNNPFWWSADDKFFNYSLMAKLGVPIPRTVLLPSKDHPPTTTSESMRNLSYPLNWDEVFEYIGFPAFLKPHDGGGWKHVYKVHNPQEFFEAYHKTGDICMTLQAAVDFTEYYRCYVIGKKYIHIMPYEPRNPHHLRYVADFTLSAKRKAELEKHCLTIVQALGYDFDTIEFAVENNIPYAIDFLNPAPDAEATSVQPENFEWVLEHSAKFLISLALQGRTTPTEYDWSTFLSSAAQSAPTPAKSTAKPASAKTPAKTAAAKPAAKKAPKK